VRNIVVPAKVLTAAAKLALSFKQKPARLVMVAVNALLVINIAGVGGAPETSIGTASNGAVAPEGRAGPGTGAEAGPKARVSA
jgi:hypothetical protein